MIVMNEKVTATTKFGQFYQSHRAMTIGIAIFLVACTVLVGRATHVTDGIAVIGNPVVPQAIYVDSRGEPMVWQDSDGSIHGHIQQRSWWICRFIAGDVYGSAEPANLTPEQRSKRLAAEAVAIKRMSEKADKDAAKAKKEVEEVKK